MADNTDWLPVLQKVFKKYGTQLQAKQVEKFAAKVARKQGRTEEKKQLQKACKKFLKTETGRNNVISNDNLLSLRKSVPLQPGSGPSPGLSAQAPAQPPAQSRLSLFDLAEAAAALSNASPQSSPAPSNRKPTKGKAVAKPKAVPVSKGPRSVRNRKTDSSSPDAHTDSAAAAPASAAASSAAPSAGMQTRGLATRRQSIDRPRGGLAALPLRPKPRAIKAPEKLPEPSMDDQAPSANAAEQDVDAAAVKPGSFAQDLSVGPSNGDANAPGPSEDVPSSSGPDSQQAVTAHEALKDLGGETAPESNQPNPAMTQPTTAALAPALLSEEPVPAPEPVKQQKHKRQSAQKTAAALPMASGSIEAGSKAAADNASLHAVSTAATAEQEAPGLSSTEQGGAAEQAAAAASEASEGRRNKHKRKHKAAVSGRQSVNPAGDASGTAAVADEQPPSQAAAEPVEPESTTLVADAADIEQAKKKKKKKRKHSQATGEQAAEALPDASAAATPAVEASLAAVAPASQALQDQALAIDSDQTAASGPQETAPKLKKKKKRKHSEAAETGQQFEAAMSSAAPAAEATALEATAAEATAAAAAEAAEPAAENAAAAAQADHDVKPKKKKKKHKHREAADADMHSAPSAAEAVSEADMSAPDPAAARSTADPGPSSAAPEPAAIVKAKKRKAKHGKDSEQQAAGPSSSQPASAASNGAAAASPQSGAAVTNENLQAAQPAAKPKRKKKTTTLVAREAAPAVEAAQLPASEADDDAAEDPAGEHAGEGAAPKAGVRQSWGAEQASTSRWGEVSWRENSKRTDVKKGKFTKAEKDTLKQAAVDYAQLHGLSTTDFAWLFCTRSLNSEYKQQAGGAWRSISAKLPHRTNKAVYACGTRMLHERNYQGKWSKEEGEQLRQLVAEKGPRWAEISRSLGRLPEGCRDKWRELKLGDAKQNGRWSEDETESLRSLVNDYMNKKQAIEEERNQGGAALSLTLDDLESGSAEPDQAQSDGRIILDDIDWDLVSEQHGTRSAAQCLTKWYTQLAPSMVTKGEWGSGDDRRLLRALLKSGATEDFHVDWGRLVASRTAQQARRRWRLMLKCVMDAHDREFSQNLNQLVTTFVPDLLPAAAAPPKPVKAKKSKRQRDKEAASAAAAVADAEYPGMSGGMY